MSTGCVLKVVNNRPFQWITYLWIDTIVFELSSYPQKTFFIFPFLECVHSLRHPVDNLLIIMGIVYTQLEKAVENYSEP